MKIPVPNGEDEPSKQMMVLVNQIDIDFNDEECQVFNFTDLTLFEHLKQEKVTTQLLKT